MASREKLLRPEADLDTRASGAHELHEAYADDDDDARTHRRPAEVWARHDAATQAPVDDAITADQLIDSALADARTILGSLVPAYVEARDSLHPAAVAKLGADIIARFTRLHSAKRRVDEFAKMLDSSSEIGSDPAHELAVAKHQDAVRGKLPVLTSLVATVDGMVAPTLTPGSFRGQLVAGVAVATSLADGPQTDPVAKLRHELARTVELLDVAVTLRATFADPKAARDGAKLTDARAKVLSYRARPLDLAFLRAALGDTWNVIDAHQGETPTQRPSAALEAGAKEAQHSGWLGDVGRFDIDTAVTDLTALGREGAEHVLDMLATADPEARTRILIQIRDRGLLDNLCRPVPWARIKRLHDSLAYGYGDIKEQLQAYFLDDGDYSSQLKGMGVALVSPTAASALYPDRAKFGPTLHDERDRHSLHSMLQDAGPVGKVVDFVENIGTFGFSSDYGEAYDAHARGETTDEEYARALNHVAGRTAVVGAVSLMTGGTADRLVRGAAPGIVRGTLAGAAGGSTGAVSGLAASDTYDVYVSGDKQSFSSPEEYAKAALLGGAIGGAISTAAHAFKAQRAPGSSRAGGTPAETGATSDVGVGLAGRNGGDQSTFAHEVDTGSGTKRPTDQLAVRAPVDGNALEAQEASTDPAKPNERVILAGSDLQQMTEYMSRVPSEPGTVDIVVHGRLDDFVIKADHGNITLDHRQLANYLESRGISAKRVRLLACSTGQHPKGVAQHLANKLGVTVEAPTDKLWIHDDGRLTIGPTDTRNTGRWEPFSPKKSEARFQKAPESPAPSLRDRFEAKRRGQPTQTETPEPQHPSGDTDADPSKAAKKTSHDLGDDTTSESVKTATVEALSKIPVARLPKGTTVAGDVDALHQDTYYVSREHAKQMLEKLAELEPEVQTRAYSKGFVVRRSGEEWYFEIHDKARHLPAHDGPRDGGLPAANAATVELWGFRGVREIAGRPQDQWTKQELEEVARIKQTEPLLYAGHVGVSMDGGKTIWGFTPHYDGTIPPDAFLRSLMAHDAYPGVVQDDTRIFREAERMAKQHGWNTQPVSAVELVDQPKKLEIVDRVRELSHMKPGEHGIGYSFPLPEPLSGEHYADSNHFKGCDVRNCAAFPEKVGVPIPEPSGNLKTYMRKLDEWAHADQPKDFRTHELGGSGE